MKASRNLLVIVSLVFTAVALMAAAIRPCQLFVRQRDRDLIGRDTGLGFRKAAAPHRRLDRIDRKCRYRESAGEAVGNCALAGAGQSGDHNELLRCHRLAQNLQYKGYSPGACALIASA